MKVCKFYTTELISVYIRFHFFVRISTPFCLKLRLYQLIRTFGIHVNAIKHLSRTGMLFI